jgi:predicted NAD/FAD-binding protein
LGGHTSTVELPSGPDRGLPVDTGFIVCNDRTYPLFHKFLQELGVAVRASDMSFGYMDEASGFHYAGTDLNGLFAQRSNFFKPRFWRLMKEVNRFHRTGAASIKDGSAEGLSFGQWLRREGFAGDAVEHYIVPMGAAIWSAPFSQILAFPAGTYLRFFGNHGLLSVRDMPQWQTVVGGSYAYLRAFKAAFKGQIRLATPVKKLHRGAKAVLTLADGSEEAFDAVVLAGHADQSLALLADASPDERRLLGAWRYQSNDTVLHSDAGLLPPQRRAWASWNYRRTREGEQRSTVAVTYHMNRLQGFTAAQDYCVTLNLSERIDPARVIKRFSYTHPVFSAEAVATQAELPGLNGQRNTYFAGSYFRYGFHEDAVMSANEVGKHFGETL